MSRPHVFSLLARAKLIICRETMSRHHLRIGEREQRESQPTPTPRTHDQPMEWGCNTGMVTIATSLILGADGGTMRALSFPNPVSTLERQLPPF